jgi:hypothetical protein
MCLEKAMVAEQVEAEHLVFVDEMGTNTPRFLLYTPGLLKESERSMFGAAQQGS